MLLEYWLLNSILGPFLYALFVSPLFDLSDLSNFADDNFVVRVNKNLVDLIQDVEASPESITKWLRDSGLKVNDSNIEVCVFHRNETATIQIRVGADSLHYVVKNHYTI